VRIYVSAKSADRAFQLADQLDKALPAESKSERPDQIVLRTWHHSRHGADNRKAKLDVQLWHDIARNYPAQVSRQLDQLMALERPPNSGKLILWHGVPGGGKTWAIRALMSAWQGWCDFGLVMDPEKAFNDSSYLLDLEADSWSEDGKDDDDNWRLIIAEDTDEFLRADAKQMSGSALGRLLNLADGILGQNSKAMFLLTTNEPIGTLHPALTRPGRALSQVEFVPFTVAEANEMARRRCCCHQPEVAR